MKSKPWMKLESGEGVLNDAYTARCERCGGISQFRFMRDWFGPGKHFTFWRWWGEFKKAHRDCVERCS